MTSPREKPILFSSAMVRAILEGRKTQTRRVLKCQKSDATELGIQSIGHATKGYILQATYRAFPKGGSARWALCEFPYGLIGDRLWVRETFSIGGNGYFYRADVKQPETIKYSWKPSIFMPRKASRLTLEITGVKVERVQSISSMDCIQEGIRSSPAKHWYHAPDYVEQFRKLWDTINGKRPKCSWSDNPFVWCISFKKL